MISFRSTIPGIASTVTPYVITSIISEIKDHLYLDDDIPINTTQNIDEILRDNWNLKASSKDIRLRQTYIDLSVEEVTNEDSGFRPLGSNHSNPIFKDGQLVIKPLYLNTSMTMIIRMNSKSKSFMVAARDKIALSAFSGNDVNIHNILYRYYIPNNTKLLMQFSYKYKHNYGLADSYTKYLLSQSDNRLSLVGTLGGKDHLLDIACKEGQSEVVGRFVFDKNKKIDFSDGRYSIEFEYTLSYQKPTYMDTQYDIVIANQQLPDALVVTPDSIDKADREVAGIMEFIRADQWFLSNLLGIYKTGYVRIPRVDNHIMLERSSHESILFSVLINISPDDKRNLFNLRELGDIALNDEVLDFLVYDREYLTREFESLFGIYIYANGALLDNKGLSVDGNLDVYTDIELDLSTTYRVFFVVNHNRSMISESGRYRLDLFLEKNGIFDSEILISLNPNRFVDYLNTVKNLDDITENESYLINECDKVGTPIDCLNGNGPLLMYLTGLVERGNGLRTHIDASIGDLKSSPIMKTVQSALIMTHLKRSK